jgi:hypothetical protein
MYVYVNIIITVYLEICVYYRRLHPRNYTNVHYFIIN